MQPNWSGCNPEVILAACRPAPRSSLQQATRTIPIVLAQAIDPVGNGYVDSLARPGGNTTGFTQFEYSLAGKWLELLKEVAPANQACGACCANPAVPRSLPQSGSGP